MKGEAGETPCPPLGRDPVAMLVTRLPTDFQPEQLHGRAAPPADPADQGVMSDQKSSSGGFPGRTPDPWAGCRMTLPQDVIGVDVSKDWIDVITLSTGRAERRSVPLPRRKRLTILNAMIRDGANDTQRQV